jgi:CBS domain-containing protein
MADSGMNGLGDGSGDARIENHRLLDSEPVRDLLTRSSPITRVAGIVSARAFEDAVLSGFTGDDPDLYVPVHVEVKSYRGDAYLRVPKPSGDLLVRGFQPSEPETGVVESTVDTKSRGLRLPVGSGSVSNFVGTVLGGSVVQAEEVGDITIGGGNIGHVDGSVVQGPSGPVHTGSGNQINLPGLADGPGDGDRAAENA